MKVRSVNNKAAAIRDILASTGLDVTASQETWHENTESFSLRRAVSPGQVILLLTKCYVLLECLYSIIMHDVYLIYTYSIYDNIIYCNSQDPLQPDTA